MLLSECTGFSLNFCVCSASSLDHQALVKTPDADMKGGIARGVAVALPRFNRDCLGSTDISAARIHDVT